MIVTKEDPKWIALLKGQIKHQFKSVAAAMMVSKCQRMVAFDSSSQAIMKSLDELYAYFTKFENVVRDDMKAIFG